MVRGRLVPLLPRCEWQKTVHAREHLLMHSGSVEGGLEAESRRARWRKEKKKKEGEGGAMAPVIYFLQLIHTYQYPVQLQTHKSVNPLMKLVPSWFNFYTAPQGSL